MHRPILITGSSGLVGSALRRTLTARGVPVRGLDLRGLGPDRGDVRDAERIAEAVRGCAGVVHLAAVSRVIWGEQDPEGCRATNIGGVKNTLAAVAAAPRPPWFIFASSREVYGQPDRLPADEDAPLQPVNIYGETKIEGERLTRAARADGVRSCIIRLSNVYGSVADHADRVVPAFARGAAFGEWLRVDGAGHTFDFSHIDDVTRGIVALVDRLSAGGDPPPPIHFVTGQPTTLGELARLALGIADAGGSHREAPPRSFDVARFFGDPGRARALLGWRAEVSLTEGLTRLIADYRATAEVNAS